MADSYLGQGYEQGGVPGFLQNVWTAPGRYVSNLVDPLLQNPVLNKNVLPPQYGQLDRPQKSIFEELFMYDPGRPMSQQAPQVIPEQPAEARPQAFQSGSGAGASFTLPGYKSSVQAPKVPDLTQLNEAIANIQAPGKKKTDSMATIMQALATTRWDDRSSTGTNLYNIGAALLGGVGLSKKEAIAAEDEANKAQQEFGLRKAELQTQATQQQFQNQLTAANMELKLEELNNQGLAPKIAGNTIVYGTRKPNGDVEYKTQQVGENKYEQLINILDRQMANTQVDISNAVLQGKVPPNVSAILTPKILQYQQQAITELGASLGLADDKTKQNLINLKVNQLLHADPELKNGLPALQQELRQQMIVSEAFKRAF